MKHASVEFNFGEVKMTNAIVVKNLMDDPEAQNFARGFEY